MKVGQRKEKKQRNKHKLKGTIYLPGVKTNGIRTSFTVNGVISRRL